MLNTRNALMNLVAAAALGTLAPSAFATEAADRNEAVDLKSLAQLEEVASTRADYERLARLYEVRAEVLEEKVDRHQRLEKRYASAPASLLAKRGTAWNTPKRQRQLGAKARAQAAEARHIASVFLEEAASAPVAAD